METLETRGCGCRVEEYFGLEPAGLLAPDDRVELLHGIVVSMSPQQPLHAATVWRLGGLLTGLYGDRAIVRCQLPLLAGADSVPEPDVAVVPWRADGYASSHPDRALLLIEVADSSIGQDRLTKSGIYAAANVPDYWVVNLRDGCVEWFREPEVGARQYRESGVARGDELLPRATLDRALPAAELVTDAGTAK